jgi:Transposase
MQSWSRITYYAGFDWATDHHDVVIVNRSGQFVADFQIEHTAEGWQRWGEQVAALGAGLAACVETSQGFVVEQLLESGVTVYPISPASAKTYRQRKVPSGNKTDHVDAWSLADALRVDESRRFPGGQQYQIESRELPSESNDQRIGPTAAVQISRSLQTPRNLPLSKLNGARTHSHCPDGAIPDGVKSMSSPSNSVRLKSRMTLLTAWA